MVAGGGPGKRPRTTKTQKLVVCGVAAQACVENVLSGTRQISDGPHQKLDRTVRGGAAQDGIGWGTAAARRGTGRGSVARDGTGRGGAAREGTGRGGVA